MNLQNWVYQHHGNTGLYYTPLPGVCVDVTLDDSGSPFEHHGRVVGFLYSVAEHEVVRVWIDHSLWGLINVGVDRVSACSDDGLESLLMKVKA